MTSPPPISQELALATDDFSYVNPACPPINIYTQDGVIIKSAHAELVRDGRVSKVFTSPELQYKEFDFGVPFGPIGWNYFYFKLVLQRISQPGVPAWGRFILDLASSSYGRYSGALPWSYDAVLLSGGSPLRKIHLGDELIGECHSVHRSSFEPPIPNAGNEREFPAYLFNAIDGVRLEAGGNQESCNP